MVVLYPAVDLIGVDNMAQAMALAEDSQEPVERRGRAMEIFYDNAKKFRASIDWNALSSLVSFWLSSDCAVPDQRAEAAIANTGMIFFPEFARALMSQIEFYNHVPQERAAGLIAAAGYDPMVSRALVDDDEFLNVTMPEILLTCTDLSRPLALLATIVLQHPTYFRLRIRDSQTAQTIAGVCEQYKKAPKSKEMLRYKPYIEMLNGLRGELQTIDPEAPFTYSPVYPEVLHRGQEPDMTSKAISSAATFALSALWMRFRAKAFSGVSKLPPSVNALIVGSSLVVSTLPLAVFAVHKNMGPESDIGKLRKVVMTETAVTAGFGLAALMLFRHFCFFPVPYFVSLGMFSPTAFCVQLYRDKQRESIYADEARSVTATRV
jgi:hypothetical protein